VLGVKVEPLRVRFASLDPCARLRPLASMIFGERSPSTGRLIAPKIMDAKAPHRRVAVTAKRAKRSGAAA
jgi:hypothetical protein